MKNNKLLLCFHSNNIQLLLVQHKIKKEIISIVLDPDQAQVNVEPYHDPSFMTFLLDK